MPFWAVAPLGWPNNRLQTLSHISGWAAAALRPVFEAQELHASTLHFSTIEIVTARPTAA